MKRLPGIIISSIVLLLGSLFQILMGVLMGTAGVIEKRQILASGNPATGAALAHSAITPAAALPPWMPIFMYVLAGFFAVLAAWGIITAIGLFRMYRWARYSVLVIGGCLAVFCLPAMFFSLALLFIPLPMPATVDPSQMNTVHSFTKIIFGVVAAIYGIVGGVGVFWLVYFNLKKVRAAFADTPGEYVPGPRPLLISMIAVLDMIGVVTMAVLMFVPFGANFLIWIFQGWQKIVFALVYGALFAATAYGLWHMKEWGRQLAIALQVVGLMQYITFLVHPYVFANYNAQIQNMMKLPQQMQDPLFYNQKIINFSMTFGMLFLIAILIILHYYRGKFRAPAEPPHSATPALP